ncbi:MBL fold metallo-hydrolase [Parvularcula maris]|uniref:beta-lactamase n=1 Tax=Parvularcula maris TaxID=2965077 RepID=A0A9X2LBR5_9PROT|nr:MBL fold metallo-hydrolase [Parvularcula maris]MCQ8186568.1 MBL fold metallo-hydrolase [Parvularcula maris]
MIRTLSLVLTAGLALTGAQAQRNFDNINITHEEAAPGVWVLYGAGGNIGLHSGEDAVFLVDDQFAPLTEKIQLKVLELTGKSPDFVLNTHFHGDHSGGNENLGEAGALIFGHENVRARILEGDNPASAPVVTFSDRQSFHINGENVRAHHVHHAHTDSDSFVHFENANVIHTGDLMFEESLGSFPFIDLQGGGSIDGVIAALEKMVETADANTVVIPGHGKLTDREGMVAYHAMLEDIRDKVQAQIDRGRSKEQIVRARPAKRYAGARQGGFISEDRFVETVYDSLTSSDG